MTEEESAKIKGEDPDHATHDLFEAIAQGDYPKWRMRIQVMTKEQASKHPDNPFDLTKVWKQGEYPLIEVGILELNRNPENCGVNQTGVGDPLQGSQNWYYTKTFKADDSAASIPDS